jgi:hypothetical protein
MKTLKLSFVKNLKNNSLNKFNNFKQQINYKLLIIWNKILLFIYNNSTKITLKKLILKTKKIFNLTKSQSKITVMKQIFKNSFWKIYDAYIWKMIISHKK